MTPGPVQMAFVTGPAVTPTSVLNLVQPGLIKVLGDSFTLGAPTFDGAPYSVGAEYGERTVSFTLQVTGTWAEATTVMQLVSRQLTQPNPAMGNRNWLMFRYQPSSDPMFLWTFQSAPGELEWENAGAEVWQLPVTLLADGFVWGPPEDIASFTITNDPTTGTNKMMVGPSVLGTVKGDVETPLMLAQTTGPGIGYNLTGGVGGALVYVASYALGGGNTHAFLARDLTELTSGTNMGAPVTGAGANYVGGNYKSCSFATATMATRLSGTFTTTFNPMPGQYRVYLRVVAPSGLGSTTPTFTHQLGVLSDGSVNYVYGDPVVTSIVYNNAADRGVLIDLGLYQFPTGSDYTAIGPGLPSTTGVAPNLSIQASADAFALALRYDEIYFVPVNTAYGQGRITLLDPTTGSGSVQHNVVAFDGVNNAVRTLFDASGTAPFNGVPVAANAMKWGGFLPTVKPGFNNYLQVFFEDTVVTDTTAITGRYYPKYLHARPDTD